MKTLSVKIYNLRKVGNEIEDVMIGSVTTSEPFERIMVSGEKEKITKILPEEIYVEGKSIERSNAKEYVSNLHKALSGTYWRAGKAEILER